MDPLLDPIKLTELLLNGVISPEEHTALLSNNREVRELTKLAVAPRLLPADPSEPAQGGAVVSRPDFDVVLPQQTFPGAIADSLGALDNSQFGQAATEAVQSLPSTIAGGLNALDNSSFGLNAAAAVRDLPSAVGGVFVNPDVPSRSDVVRLPDESITSFSGRQGDAAFSQASALIDEALTIEDGENFLTNLGDLPKLGGAAIAQASGLGDYVNSYFSGLFTSGNQRDVDARIRSVGNDFDSPFPPLTGDANDLPPLEGSTNDLLDPAQEVIQGIESGNPNGPAEQALSPLSAAYAQYADNLNDFANQLTPPPELNEREFWLGNMLNIANRGTLTPSAFQQADWENNLVFDQARIGLQAQASQAILQGNIAQAGVHQNRSKDIQRFQNDLRSKRSSFIKGDGGDFWFSIQNSDNQGASSAALRDFAKFNEQAWIAALAEDATQIGLDADENYATMTLEELQSVASGNDKLSAHLRSIGVDIEKVIDKPVEFKDAISNLLVSKGLFGLDGVENISKAFPQWGQRMRIGDNVGFEGFLSPQAKAGLDQISGFNQGGTQGQPLPAGEPFIKYTNQGAVRDKPLSNKMVSALSFLPEMGISIEVYSGGQPSFGRNRTGSRRHDHGDAGDMFLRMNGRRLDWRKKSDIPIYQEVIRRAKKAGLTGFGAGPGYMAPGAIHMGFGSRACWGAGGKGANAPKWLREACH